MVVVALDKRQQNDGDAGHEEADTGKNLANDCAREHVLVQERVAYEAAQDDDDRVKDVRNGRPEAVLERAGESRWLEWSVCGHRDSWMWSSTAEMSNLSTSFM